MGRYEARELLPPPYSRRSPSTPGEWLRILRAGLPSRGLEALLASLDISRAELCAALNIPERTLARRLGEGRLAPEESEKVLRLGRVWERANVVFPDEVAARSWMKSPNPALGRETPLSLLDADVGADAVLNLLGRIEHGVFS